MTARPELMSENDLQRAVIDTAKALGWLVHHDRPGRTNHGWRTVVEGDAGYPDLTLCHFKHGVVFAELKGPRGTFTPEQQEWGLALNKHARYEIWTPADYRSGRIDRILRGEKD